MISAIINKFRTTLRTNRLRKAIRVVESEGLHVCNMKELWDSVYLVDKKGSWHKVGRKA